MLKRLLSAAVLILAIGGIAIAANNFAINNATGTFTVLKSTDDGTGVQILNTVPVTSGASAAIDVTSTGIVRSGAVESSKVICSSACNLLGMEVSSGAAAVWVLGYNLAAVPGDGAVTPDFWVELPSISTVSRSFTVPYDRYPTGLTLACSSTGPFTQTLSATCVFRGRKQ